MSSEKLSLHTTIVKGCSKVDNFDVFFLLTIAYSVDMIWVMFSCSLGLDLIQTGALLERKGQGL